MSLDCMIYRLKTHFERVLDLRNVGFWPDFRSLLVLIQNINKFHKYIFKSVVETTSN